MSASPELELAVNLGAVFTRRWVVDLVLDLAGYTPDKDLANGRVLEPSVGHGAFATAIAERLLASCRQHGREIADCGGALRGFDVDATAVNATRANVSSSLIAAGVVPDVATELVEQWFQEADFLLTSADDGMAFDWVVGNPPYIRVEDVKAETLQAYRAAWPTMSGRADVYVGFFEAGLAQLADGGRLAFICADRWMRNQYGAAIRERIVKDFAVDACVVMHTVDAFENSVSAYPAVVTIRRGDQEAAFVAETSPGFGARDAEDLLSDWTDCSSRSGGTFESSWTPGWFEDSRSWPAGRPAALTQVHQFEQALPTLEEAGVRIAVGTATGADAVFVTASTQGIEEERLVKAVFAKDVSTGQVAWSGRWLVNPWRENKLVELADFPGAARYWQKHEARLKARYVAKKSPTTWWRTIDRVGRDTASKPKLLVPDLKDRIFPVLDKGEYQPMHSLYYLTSNDWDLEVLGGLLLSDTANSFVEAYSVRMANGYMRVSAQYLRRVRVPSYSSIPQELRDALRTAFEARDVAAAEAAAQAAYTAAIESDQQSRPQEHAPSAG